ncbi:hypothetical protein ES703_118700 [subsurface metagenome]
MFKIILKTDRRVFISSKTRLVIIPISTFERARGRKARGARIRKPISVVVHGELFVFTPNEWAKGKKMASNNKEFLSDLPWNIRMEIEDKVKMSKRLAEQRALRLKIEADAAAAQMGIDATRSR